MPDPFVEQVQAHAGQAVPCHLGVTLWRFRSGEIQQLCSCGETFLRLQIVRQGPSVVPVLVRRAVFRPFPMEQASPPAEAPLG